MCCVHQLYLSANKRHSRTIREWEPLWCINDTFCLKSNSYWPLRWSPINADKKNDWVLSKKRRTMRYKNSHCRYTFLYVLYVAQTCYPVLNGEPKASTFIAQATYSEHRVSRCLEISRTSTVQRKVSMRYMGWYHCLISTNEQCITSASHYYPLSQYCENMISVLT